MTRFELKVRVSSETIYEASEQGWDQVHYFWTHHSYAVDDPPSIVGDFDPDSTAVFRADVLCYNCESYLEEIVVYCDRFSHLYTNNIELQSDDLCSACLQRTREESDEEVYDPRDWTPPTPEEATTEEESQVPDTQRDVEEEGDCPATVINGSQTNSYTGCLPESLYSSWYGLRFDE